MQAFADRGDAACTGGQRAGRAVGLYRRRRPATTVLYQLVQEHLETFLSLSEEGTGEGFRGYVERDFPKYLDCGILARGRARARCKDCGEDFLTDFSCKARGACPSCNTRRMVEFAACSIASSPSLSSNGFKDSVAPGPTGFGALAFLASVGLDCLLRTWKRPVESPVL
ncbi:MAG: transposase zinc-binding domain-containing protein [Chromatiaceae bacterium]